MKKMSYTNKDSVEGYEKSYTLKGVIWEGPSLKYLIICGEK